MIKMATQPLRTEVIRLYSRILRVGRKWQAQDPNETKVERQYIQEEAKALFRKNKNLKNVTDIRQSLVEAEARQPNLSTVLGTRLSYWGVSSLGLNIFKFVSFPSLPFCS